MNKIIILCVIVINIFSSSTEIKANEIEGPAININNKEVEKELDKLSKQALSDLKSIGIDIVVENHIDESRAASTGGRGVAGYYDSNERIVYVEKEHIEWALTHEIGHALDYNFLISNDPRVKASYDSKEIKFEIYEDYYYSSIEEYIAESYKMYCNDKLNANTYMYEVFECYFNNIDFPIE